MRNDKKEFFNPNRWGEFLNIMKLEIIDKVLKETINTYLNVYEHSVVRR